MQIQEQLFYLGWSFKSSRGRIKKRTRLTYLIALVISAFALNGGVLEAADKWERASDDGVARESGPVRRGLGDSIWSDLYLSDLESLHQSVDELFALKLADAASRYARRRNTKGMCLQGVRQALHHVLSETNDGASPLSSLNFLPSDTDVSQLLRHRQPPGQSAESFRRWASQNPFSLCFHLGLADVRSIEDLRHRKGFIHIYGKGSCGFHGRYGHIEIITDESRHEVCSDHCRIREVPCIPDLVLAPVKSCDWLIQSQRNLSEVLAYNAGGEMPSISADLLPTWRDELQELDGAQLAH